MKKVEETRALFQQAQDKIEASEAELIVEKVAVTAVESLVKKKDDEIQMVERALRDQSAEVEKLQEKCAVMEALEAKIAAMEKVNAFALYKLCTAVLTTILVLCFNLYS